MCYVTTLFFLCALSNNSDEENVCVCVCARVCVRARVCVCVCVRARAMFCFLLLFLKKLPLVILFHMRGYIFSIEGFSSAFLLTSIHSRWCSNNRTYLFLQISLSERDRKSCVIFNSFLQEIVISHRVSTDHRSSVRNWKCITELKNISEKSIRLEARG